VGTGVAAVESTKLYASGHVWRTHDLRAITAMIMLFTMVFTTMLAGFRLADDDSPP
jgi:hypothetical protein